MYARAVKAALAADKREKKNLLQNTLSILQNILNGSHVLINYQTGDHIE